MFYTLLFLFCQFVTAFVFVISVFAKLRNFEQFVQTITNFRILPARLTRVSAIAFLLAESAVLLLLAIQPALAQLLAMVLLLIFTAGLASVVVRKIQTPCHCFGNSQHLVTSIDLVRNAGFGLSAAVGYGLAQQSANYPVVEVGLIGLTALTAFIFVLTWTQLNELYELFRPSLTDHRFYK